MSTIDERAGVGSGSGYARDKGCPANRKMERLAKELGKEPPVEKCAEEGKTIHALVCLYPFDRTPDGVVIEASDDEHEGVSFLAARLDRIVDDFLDGRHGTVTKEKRFWLYKGLQVIRSSKPDYVLIVNEPDGADILIVDHKTGHAEIDPENADTWAQLEEYALTVALNTQHPRGIKRVRSVINSRWSGVHSKDFPPEYLIAVHRELLATIAAGNVEHPHENPGWYCRYCAGRLVCPSATRELAIVEKYALNPAPEGKAGEERLDLVLRVKSLCDQYIKHYRNLLTAQPEGLGAWRISEGDQYRSITDLEGAFVALVSDGHITQDEFMECCDGYVGKMEKKYCNRAKKPAVQAKKDFNALLAGVIELKRKAGSLEKVKELL
jgi:hypothetical protein